MVKKLLPEKTSVILEAAQKRFARYGLLKTSMNDIALAIGMSKASLYYYFPDKEALFSEVVRREQAQFINEIEKVIREKESAEDILTCYVQKRLTFFENLLNLSKLSSENLRSVKPIFSSLSEKLREEEIRLIKSILKKGIENQKFERVNVTDYSELFIAVIQGLRANVVNKKDLEQLGEMDYQGLRKQCKAVTRIFVRGLKK